MPKLKTFKIKIETGDSGIDEPVRFSVNGFQIPFEDFKGTPQSGETFEGSYDINSFPHSLSLVGPEKGDWNIKEMAVEFHVENADPYSVSFGEIKLDETNEANIWQDPPLPTFDV
jgi:hypothetical protein